jgi:hypothetical protein
MVKSHLRLQSVWPLFLIITLSELCFGYGGTAPTPTPTLIAKDIASDRAMSTSSVQVETGIALGYINMGFLPSFAPPASCFELTVDCELALDTASKSDVSGTYFTMTATYSVYTSSPTATVTYTSSIFNLELFGAGVAWLVYNSQTALRGSELYPPPMSCFPENYFEAFGYEIQTAIPVPYYSPAVACPASWTPALTTTYNSSVVSVGNATSTATETGVMCCPGAGGSWSAYVAEDYCRTSALKTGSITAGAYFTDYVGTITASQTILDMSFTSTASLARELPIWIRWQSSDLTALPEATTPPSSEAARSLRPLHTRRVYPLIVALLALLV